MNNNINKIGALLVFFFILSMYLYHAANNDNWLIYKTWHSNIAVDLAKFEGNFPDYDIKDIKDAEISGDFKFFKSKGYSQDIAISLYDHSDNIIYSAEFVISGKWDYSEGYLFFETDEEKIDFYDIIGGETIPKKVRSFLIEMTIKNFKQSKYVEIINDNTLLMIGIDNQTSIWSAVKDI